MDLKKKVRTNSQVVFTEVDECEGVLLSLETQKYFSLNETGVFVWKRLEGEASILEIVGAIQEEYEVDTERAVNSVVKLLEDLESENLVEMVASN